MQFEFSTATQIIFGRGKLLEIGQNAKVRGSKAMVVYGSSLNRSAQLISELDDHGIKYIMYSVKEEPTIEVVRTGVEICRHEECDLVIAIGGGSIIDAGKAIAILSANDGDIVDYLEVIGRGMEISNPGIPMIAIPTTAGTGSEVTRNAVIGAPDHQVKVSLRSQHLLPTIAIIDPDLTISMSPEVTASTGLDALTQLIEPFVSKKANPLTDAICQEGMKYSGGSILNAYRNGKDTQSRVNLSLASLFSGFALANAKLGAVHGFAGVLGGMYHAPHGVICAALLPPVMKVNIQALQKREPESQFISRFERIAQILIDNVDSRAEEAVDFIWQLNLDLSIPTLSNYGVTEDAFPEIIVKAAGSSSMKGNPILLNPDELYSILEMAV
jgi:alcohol dehydrogenase class IV